MSFMMSVPNLKKSLVLLDLKADEWQKTRLGRNIMLKSF